MSALRAAAPLSVPIPCRGERHELRYEHGQLLAPDHPDVDGELALAALGGESAPCAELVSAWRAAATDLRVLTLTSRSASDRLDRPPVEVLFASQGRPPGGSMSLGSVVPGMPSPAVFPGAMGRPGRGHSSFGWASSSPMPSVGFARAMGRAGPAKPEPLVRLLAVSAALTQRLVTEVVASWTARIADGDAPASALPALSAALAGRAKAALTEWAGLPFERVDVGLGAADEPPTVDFADKLCLTLPFAWLADVWLPGLSQLLGRFTLAASEQGDTVRLSTIDSSMQRGDVIVNLASVSTG